jgi:type IV secretory pathway VirB4 component
LPAADTLVREERSLAPHLPVRDVRHDLIWGIEGDVSLVYRMRAYHEPALDDDGFNTAAFAAENAWSGMPDGTRYQIIVLVDHKKAIDALNAALPPITGTDPTSRLLEEMRQARMVQLTRQDTRGDGFILQQRRHYLVATFRPEALQTSALKKLKASLDQIRLLLSGRPASDAPRFQEILEGILKEADVFDRRVYRGLTTQHGLDFKRCKSREIVTLLHELLSPTSAEASPVTHLSGWARDNYRFPKAVTEAEPYLADTSPIASVLDDDLVVHENRLDLGDRHIGIIALKELPDQTEAGMIVPLLRLPREKYRLVYSINIPDKRRTIEDLRSQTDRAAGLESATLVKSSRKDAAAEVIGNQANEAMRRLIASKDRMFGISMNLVLLERSPEALEGAVQETLSAMASTHGLRGYRETYNLLPAFLSLLPGAPRMGINRQRRAVTPVMVDMMPVYDFHSGRGKIPFLTPNNSVVFYDNFDTDNQFNCNGLILAPSGTGKSVTAQLYYTWYMISAAAAGDPPPFVCIIDNGASYKRAIDVREDARYVQFSFDEPPGINAFEYDPAEEGRREHVSRLEGLLIDILRLETPDEQEFEKRKIVLQRALLALFPETGGPRFPQTFEGFAAAIAELDREAGGRGSAREILDGRLGSFTGDGKFARLCQPNTRLALNESIKTVCYDLKGLLDHPDFAMVSLRLIIYQIRRFSARMNRRRGHRTLLIIDESWALLDKATGGNAATMAAGFLAATARMGRKEGLGCLGLSQSLAEYLATPMGRTIVENSSTKLLGPPDQGSVPFLQEKLGLNDRQVEQLKRLKGNQEYREFLLIQDNVSQVVRMPLDPLSWALFTTKAEDIDRHAQLAEAHPELSLLERVRLMAKERNTCA